MPMSSPTCRHTNVQQPSMCRVPMRAHWQLGRAFSPPEHIQKAIQTVPLLAQKPLLWPPRTTPEAVTCYQWLRCS